MGKEKISTTLIYCMGRRKCKTLQRSFVNGEEKIRSKNKNKWEKKLINKKLKWTKCCILVCLKGI
jgi:hypothetical protein